MTVWYLKKKVIPLQYLYIGEITIFVRYA